MEKIGPIILDGRPKRWMRPREDSRKGRKTFRFTDRDVQAASDRIRDEVALHWRGRQPHVGPIAIGTLFVFAIPKSWPKVTRDAALDGKVWHVADPDFDQLLKLVMDALRGLVYVDDNQVVGPLPGSAKRYGHPERTEITIMLLDQPDGAVTPGQRRLEKREAQQAQMIKSGRLGRTRNTSKEKSKMRPIRGFSR